MSRLLVIASALAALLAGCVAAAEATPEGEPPSEAPAEGPPLVDAQGKADGVELPAYGPLPAGADLEAPLSALFAPDDPVNTIEVDFIDRVREARRADPTAHAEGENPYRIRYAVYNLRNPRILEHLASAEEEGVDVQILIESGQLDPARDYNTGDEYLVGRGFELVGDHRDLDAGTRRTADLVGIVDGGLMHLKARLFETPEWSALLTGSLNPGDNAVLNEETLHLVREPRIVAQYGAAFEAVRDERPLANAWHAGEPVNVLFTPAGSGPRAATRVLDWIADEREQILLMVFSLREVTAPGHGESLVELLGRKASEGVPVYVITDRKQSDGVDAEGNPHYRNDRTEDRLRAAGVHVFEATNRATPFTAMHHKVAVLGRSRIRVITDAANWTFAGLGSSTRTAKNVESVLFVDTDALDGGRTGRRYLAQWLRVLSRYAHQSEAEGEPTFEEVRRRLMETEGWPAQRVAFAADEVHTSWGERVWVRGDSPDLGRWGAVHEGVALTTDPGSYPSWWSPDPVTLPLGSVFEWKLVAGEAADNVRWEGGDNRTGLAAPPTLVPDDTVTLRATWR